MKLAGKTLIKTPALVALIERDAKGWKLDRKRVEKAVAARPDVARKRAETASPRKQARNNAASKDSKGR